MRKLVIILIAVFAVVTFIRVFAASESNGVSSSAEAAEVIDG